MPTIYVIARGVVQRTTTAAGAVLLYRFLITVLVTCIASRAVAQIQRLPPVDRDLGHDRLALAIAPRPNGPVVAIDETSVIDGSRARAVASIPVTNASYPQSLSESNLPAAQLEPPRSGLSSSKNGFLQRVSLSATLLGRQGAGDLQQTEIALYGTVGLPMPTRESPLLITPGYEFLFLNGPAAADLPSTLQDAYLQLRWLRKLGERWGVDIAVSPGVHSDFERWNDEAIRITGHGVAQWNYSDAVKLVMGIAYLDRDDVSLLPAAGVIWTPTDSIRCDLFFPRPKLSWRLTSGGDVEDWLYLAGEFGGGSWYVQRTGGIGDTLTLRDYRIALGMERKRDGGGGRRLEAAWVFGRQVEFGSGIGDYRPDSAFMARGVIAY